jgi:hypothetical protein
VLQVKAHADHATGRLRLRLTDGGDHRGRRRHQPPVLVDVAVTPDTHTSEGVRRGGRAPTGLV